MLGALLALVCVPAAALAAAPVAIEHAPAEPAGVEHLHYAAGPYHIIPART